MKDTNYLVGFFQVEGQTETHSVETELTGDGQKDYATLWELIRKKFPTQKLTRTGSTIEARKVETRKVEYPVGATLKQLFASETAGDEECSLPVGTVTFNDQPCDVILRYHRAKNVVGVTLRERASRVPIRFSDPIKGMRPAREAADVIKTVLGNQARDLKLDLVEVSAKP